MMKTFMKWIAVLILVGMAITAIAEDKHPAAFKAWIVQDNTVQDNTVKTK